MSDYFSELVQRSLGLADVVRPRVASRFEPRFGEPQSPRFSQDFVPLTEPASLPAELGSPISERSSKPSDPQPSRTMIASQSIANDTVDETRPVEGLGSPLEMRELETARQPHGQPSPYRRREEQLPPDEGFGIQPDPSPVKIVSGKAVEQRWITDLTAARKDSSAVNPILGANSANGEGSGTHLGTDSLRLDVEHDFETAPRLDSGISAPGLRHPATEPFPTRIFARKQSAERQEQPAIQPAIQVTIGRVEVRATATDTPKRREPASTPTMTLEDYLRKRRNGAGR